MHCLQAKEHELETKKAMKKLLQGNLTVGKMEEKLKVGARLGEKLVYYGLLDWYNAPCTTRLLRT